MTQTYLNIGTPKEPVTIWWAKDSDPTRIHLTTGDPRFTDENGGRLGLRVVFSSNPRSADYNPGNFNRCARALADAGIAAPDLVPVHPRHLKQRSGVIAELAAEEAAAAADTALGDVADSTAPASLSTASGASIADPAEYGWATCPICWSIVVDLDAHAATCSK
jgi:hypothetical protein